MVVGGLNFNNNLALENVSDDQGGGYFFVDTAGTIEFLDTFTLANGAALTGDGVRRARPGDVCPGRSSGARGVGGA